LLNSKEIGPRKIIVLFPSSFFLLQDTFVSMIEAFLFKIYRTLEQEFGEFGELGIDFGIDGKCELWFIEPNAKTAKVSLQKAYSEKQFQRSFDNLVEYAKFLYSESRKYGISP
jgi:hypothetical protein